MSGLGDGRRLIGRANTIAVREAWEQHGQREDDGSGRRLSETLLTVARAAGCAPGDVDAAWVHQAMMLLVAHVSSVSVALSDRPLLESETERVDELATLGDCEPWLEWAAERLNERLSGE